MSYNPNFSGNGNVTSTKKVASNIINNSGVTILKATPIRVDNSGDADIINVSNEAHIESLIGVVTDDVLNGQQIEHTNSGRLTNLTTSFNFGDAVFISKTGTLTNTKPEEGQDGFLAGDYVIKIGVITKNEDNPANKDIIVCIEMRGQL